MTKLLFFLLSRKLFFKSLKFCMFLEFSGLNCIFILLNTCLKTNKDDLCINFQLFIDYHYLCKLKYYWFFMVNKLLENEAFHVIHLKDYRKFLVIAFL